MLLWFQSQPQGSWHPMFMTTSPTLLLNPPTRMVYWKPWMAGKVTFELRAPVAHASSRSSSQAIAVLGLAGQPTPR